MTRALGRSMYGAQGGDWGAVVSSWLGVHQPEAVVGLHLNMLGLAAHRGTDGAPLSDEEQAWVSAARSRLHRDGAYQAIQGTKPTTLNVGLTDSPAALAAWIVEKFQGWSDAGPDAPPPYDRDLLLANITLYWVTGSIATAKLALHFDPSAGRHTSGCRRVGDGADGVRLPGPRFGAATPRRVDRAGIQHRTPDGFPVRRPLPRARRARGTGRGHPVVLQKSALTDAPGADRV